MIIKVAGEDSRGQQPLFMMIRYPNTKNICDQPKYESNQAVCEDVPWYMGSPSRVGEWSLPHWSQPGSSRG